MTKKEARAKAAMFAANLLSDAQNYTRPSVGLSAQDEKLMNQSMSELVDELKERGKWP